MKYTFIIETLVSIAVIILSAYVVPFIRTKIGYQKAKRIEEVVSTIVKSVEQTYKGISGAGAEKKSEVIKQLVEDGILKSANEVTKYIDNIIESTVYEMNK